MIFNKAHLHHKLSLNEAPLALAVLGVVVGLLAGLTANLFRLALETPLPSLGLVAHYDDFESLPRLALFLLPLCGSAILAIFFHYLPAANRELGVAHVIDFVQNSRGPMPWRNGLAQFFGATVALLSGQSCGREGPGIHLGAVVSSLLGQHLYLPHNVQRLLVACGSAAAIGALFNTPIAGVIFAMEVIMLEYTIAGFTHIILAAVSGTLVTQLIYGDKHVFMMADVSMQSLAEIPFVILMGLMIGVLASLFIRLQTVSLSFSSIDLRKRLLLAGLLTGVVAMFIPEVMGTGYDSLSLALEGGYTLGFLALLVATKLVLTPIVLGLGIPGGFIGTTLMVGGIVGAMMGSLGAQALPGYPSETGFYVLLGMCAMMGSVLQAPLAALMATLEISNNSNLILPAMLIIVVANLTVSAGFRHESIYQVILRARGIKTPNNLARMLNRYAVSSIMKTDFVALDVRKPDWPEELQELVAEEKRWLLMLFPLPEEKRSKRDFADVRIMELSSMNRLLTSDHNWRDEQALLDILLERSTAVGTLSLQSTLQEALDYMEAKGIDQVCIRAPVRLGQERILGFVGLDDIMHFYRDR